MPHFIVGRRQRYGIHSGVTVMFAKHQPGKKYKTPGIRQEARHQAQGQHMVMVNGFEIMNRLSSKKLAARKVS